MVDFENLKLGLLPNDPAKPRMRFAEIFTGIVPEHPESADYLAGTSGWKMLGNDQYGDCVAVGMANTTRHITGKLATEDYPDQAEVFQMYATQNGGLNSRDLPNRDGGMVIQDCLAWWNKNTWAGRKLVAFAQVDFHDERLLKAAIAIFGGVVIGFSVTDANMQQFSSGKPFDYVRTSRVRGGHLVMCGGYTPELITQVTWSKTTSFTKSCIQNQWSECWVPILPEHLGTKAFQQGISGKKLAEAYFNLTGRKIDIPDVPDPPKPPKPPEPPSPSGMQSYIITGRDIVITRIS